MSNHDLIETNELSRNSMGGTELLQRRLYDGKVPRELLEKTQIIFSRVRDLEPAKRRVLYLHDLPEDPESARLSDPEYRNKFDKFVLVSNWQMNEYNAKLGVPYGSSVVIRNSIDPIQSEHKLESRTVDREKIRLIYHTTPHRGLEILVPVFVELAKKYPQVELDVYSSFNLYGWGERDKPYETLFKVCDEHPQIRNHGTVSNEELRKALVEADIFPYPCIWKETSCLCLIEAMSAGVLCIHPNLAALPETSMNTTLMYQWDEDPNRHAYLFYQVLDYTISRMIEDRNHGLGQVRLQKFMADSAHSWEARSRDWTALLTSLQG